MLDALGSVWGRHACPHTDLCAAGVITLQGDAQNAFMLSEGRGVAAPQK